MSELYEVVYSYTIDEAIDDGTHVDARNILLPVLIEPKFQLGRIVMTVGVFDLIEINNLAGQIKINKPDCTVTFQTYELYLTCCLERHAVGDWGNVPRSDAKLNDVSLKDGSRIMSSYYIDPRLPQRGEFWIITEADRSLTTLLLPCEY